jgi:hypothetical protein
MDGPVDPHSETFADASSILVLAPTESDPDDEACLDLLTTYDLSSINVLSATVAQSASERLDLWCRDTEGTMPAGATIVDASWDDVSTTGGRPALPGDEGSTQVSVRRLPSNAEPIDLGMAIARYLGAWESAPESTILCLHSLTDLLDRFDRETVVSLASGLNDLCEDVGATAHHHLDPAAHDEETVATLRPLYDTVVEHMGEDGWTVTNASTDADRPSFRRSTTPPGGTAGTDPSHPETVPMPYSFDQTLDLISVARRRTLLYHLKDRGTGTIPLDDLVDAVATRERAIPARDTPDSVESVRVSLVHAHLPRLADLGILDYDAESSTVEYYGNPALESFLRYVETLELG